MKKLKIGSLFSGIGGFELGIERAIEGAETIWQVEQNKFCQKILRKHWPNAIIYDDVRDITKHNVEPVDILIGGFPCQSISVSGKMEGLQNEEKSGLWWEMWRIIGELRPRLVVMENVPNIVRLGGLSVLGSLAEIGYNAEWTIISARKNCGAPHVRKRWFCVAYPTRSRCKDNIKYTKQKNRQIPKMSKYGNNKKIRKSYWQKYPIESPLCELDDGISERLARLKALGNAIVPQCSEYIGECIVDSGLLDYLFE